MRTIYASIDIGTYSIKFVVAEYFNQNFYVLASHSENSKGIKKGLIVDPTLVVETIKKGIKSLSESLGIEIKRVLVNVPDYHVKFTDVTGEVDIIDKVTSQDVNHVIKNSIYNQLIDNYELVTLIPVSYQLDGHSIVGKPIGKNGQKLKIKGIMISMPKKNIYSVLNAIENAGLEVVDITVNGLSGYFEVHNADMDKKCGAIINLGHETTIVSIFENGKLVKCDTLQIGGVNVEKDLSYVFGINRENGRKLKEEFASSHKRFCQLTEIYEVNNNVGEKIKLNQLEVSEVVMSRMVEILSLAKKQIRLLADSEIEYIVLTGGLTEIKSFKNLAYEIFGKDVMIYTMTTLGCRDNKYVNSVGMIKYFVDKMDSRGKSVTMLDTEEEAALVANYSSKKKKNSDKNSFVDKIMNGFRMSKEDKDNE